MCSLTTFTHITGILQYTCSSILGKCQELETFIKSKGAALGVGMQQFTKDPRIQTGAQKKTKSNLEKSNHHVKCDFAITTGEPSFDVLIFCTHLFCSSRGCGVVHDDAAP